jgi:hypothetical protein
MKKEEFKPNYPYKYSIGTLVVEKKIACISFEGFPSINLDVNTNEDGSKSFSGEHKWNPLKIHLTHKYGDEISGGNYDVVYLFEKNISARTFKLTDCTIDLNKNELVFNNCQVFL